ncbi:MAG TPA: phenylalanine--tRNA ligase subunit beta, partial [Smithella sp.]|nr:phenylalanine--tRNA ligase subunit beta [Smithella sp.]
HTLPKDTLLICDGVKPVAIGGIMGGLNSEVKDDTQIILLESAYFNPASIRRSARKLAMPTDAAFRFERGIDPEGVVNALTRAAQLIADISGGSICKNYIDEYPKIISTAKDIPLRLDRISRIIGTEIGAKDVTRILRSIGMVLKHNGKGRYLVTPPTCRVDISREIDLIEEVIRLYGYDRVPVTLPAVSVTEMEIIPRLDMEERIRQLLTGSGYTEIVNYSFGTPETADILCLPENDERRRPVRIKNPLGEDLSAMRTTMIHGLLETAKRNANNSSFDLKIFEIGRIFLNPSRELPEEKNMIAGLLTGKLTDDFWSSKKIVDFYTLKGCLENVFFDLKINNCRYISKTAEPFLHPGKSCGVYLNEKKIGFLGEIHPDVLEKIDLKNNIYVYEINLDILVAAYLDQNISCQEISKFPTVIRDTAFVIPDAMEADQILNVVLGQKEDLLENVIIFDVYKGKEILDGEKSLGLRFSYRASDKTLTDLEAKSVHDRIVQNTVNLTGAKIRT